MIPNPLRRIDFVIHRSGSSAQSGSFFYRPSPSLHFPLIDPCAHPFCTSIKNDFFRAREGNFSSCRRATILKTTTWLSDISPVAVRKHLADSERTTLGNCPIIGNHFAGSVGASHRASSVPLFAFHLELVERLCNECVFNSGH